MAEYRGRSTWSLDNTAMDGVWPKIQSAARVALWLSWVTVAWAAISQLLFHAHFRIPVTIQLATLLSGAAAFVGGCLGILYLAIGARRVRPFVFGVAAAAVNFGYFWYFAESIFNNPP